MSGTSDFKLDENLVAGAAEVIHGYTQSRRNLLKRTPLAEEDATVRYARMADAEGAILYYLRAMSEKGFRMMPREASAEMGMAGYVAALPVFEGEQCEPNPTDWQNCWQAMFDTFAAEQKNNPQQGGGAA